MRIRESHRVWTVRLAAILVVAVFVGLVARIWHPVHGFTAFIQLNAENDDLKIPAFRADDSIYVYRDTGGYDGLYYAQIAYDPLLRSADLPKAMDNLSYRARRILMPAIAWVTAFGDESAIVHRYAWLNLVAWVGLAGVLWRILAVRDLHSFLGWTGVVLSAGALGSVRLALSDLPMTALLATAMFAAERGRRNAALGWFVGASLARETAVLALPALVDRPWWSRQAILRVAVAIVPLAAWLAYVQWRVGPANQGFSNLTLPLAGWLEKWGELVVAWRTMPDRLLVVSSAFAIVGVSVQAGYILRNVRQWNDRWWRLGAGYTALLMILNTAVWEGFPGASLRVLLPLTLAFNVLAVRRRASLRWLVLGNLGVLSGFVSLRDLPYTRDLFYDTTRGGAIVARIDSGWAGIERDGDHFWTWSRGESVVVIELRGPRPLRVNVRGGLRSVNPRQVTVTGPAGVHWSGPVARAITPVEFGVELAPGRTVLQFTTDQPAIAEGAAPDARQLAYALYDVRIEPAP